MSATAELHPTLAEATEHQPTARAAVAAALAAGPTHAYALTGPSGSGKRATARAFAAELLAARSDDPEEARRRALAEPSPHPDLTWLRPPGNQHLVEDVRRQVIGAISYRPFEGGRSVYVIEAADAMAEESQNALLKTLEEPPPYAHLLLISSEPDGLLETVRSRCAQVSFAPLPRAVVERRLADSLGLEPEAAAALAALADGDLERARFLGSEPGRRMRELVEGCCRAARAGDIASRPWRELLDVAEEVGKAEGEAVSAAAAVRAEEFGKGRDGDRIRRDGADAAKRAERRTRTASIDTALGLAVAWFADLAACAEGAPELVRNGDRRDVLVAEAEGVEAAAALSIAERAMEVRRRLQVNVNEELALESLFHRAAATLGEM